MKTNIQSIETNIQKNCELSHRNPHSVNLICVSKSVDNETTKQVADTGIVHFAENRMEKLIEKKAFLSDQKQIKWHFIGNLQRRKVKNIINDIDYFHALDNFKLAEEINKRALNPIKCFVQVNVSEETSKQGLTISEVEEFIQSLSEFKNVVVIGLMTMAPFEAKREELQSIFSTLNKLKVTIEEKDLSYAPCTELSMGMSRDYEVAIQEGATFVRVGSKFFNEEGNEVAER
ncbi:MAG TPA: YggS family pyridoxal phosphate-dependent enzyme [Vagococcus sp.]|nr:YggS family pyridoxal phosphate-dependent enzyme [Vagococcus sp.]